MALLDEVCQKPVSTAYTDSLGSPKCAWRVFLTLSESVPHINQQRNVSNAKQLIKVAHMAYARPLSDKTNTHKENSLASWRACCANVDTTLSAVIERSFHHRWVSVRTFKHEPFPHHRRAFLKYASTETASVPPTQPKDAMYVACGTTWLRLTNHGWRLM